VQVGRRLDIVVVNYPKHDRIQDDEEYDSVVEPAPLVNPDSQPAQGAVKRELIKRLLCVFSHSLAVNYDESFSRVIGQ
jgi:hypothetical protein